MLRRGFLPVLALFALMVLGVPARSANERPTVEQFKQVLNARLQKLKTDGYPVRTVLFQEVRAGTPNGGYYPFQVTAIIHDYGPGFPANKFYGETRIGKIDKWKFDLRRDEFGAWVVQGRMTPEFEYHKNPAEGVSAVPVDTLPGTPVAKSPASGEKGGASEKHAPKQTAKNGELYLGEYACYGTGNRLMAGMGFRLKAGGTYQDLDGKRGGQYAYDARAHTISFRGGFLDGQVGRNVQSTGFQLSATVRAEPWR